MRIFLTFIFLTHSLLGFSQSQFGIEKLDTRTTLRMHDSFVQVIKPQLRTVAITIDDVPNTRNFAKNDFNSKLLRKLDSLSIPVTIFINEGLVFQGDSVKNKELLEQWISRPYITPANHTFSHSRYSEVGFEQFSLDVIKGARLSRKLASKYQKEVNYFRFPYNDLGIDSSEHVQIHRFLEEENYISTPFTIETSDWMFNAMYEKYMNRGDSLKAAELGRMYVTQTLRSFAFYDSLMNAQYGRNVDQIYLCHDNRLNEDWLPELIQQLSGSGYDFISLEDALSDEVYTQQNVYWKKWGISWCYRWMNPSDRKTWMQLEPDLGGIEEIYLLEIND